MVEFLFSVRTKADVISIEFLKGGEKLRSIIEHQHRNSEYTLENILGQSLWYSRWCIESVSLMSGFGICCEYDRAKVSRLLRVLNIKNIEHILPENMTLLKAVYKKGDPHHCNAFNGNKNDFHNFLWDKSSFKKVINPSSQAYLILDEIMIAKFLYKQSISVHSIKNIASTRATALVLVDCAKMQCEFMSGCLRNSDGLLVSKEDTGLDTQSKLELSEEEGPPSVSDQALAMRAFSALADVLHDKNYPFFEDDSFAGTCKNYADEIYSMLQDSPDDVFSGKTKDLCNIISSCTEYYKVGDPDSVLNFIMALSLELESRLDMSGNLLNTPGENDLSSSSSCFISIKSLIEAFRITGLNKLLSAAELIYEKLNLLWDSTNNLYSLDSDDKYKYTLRDIGAVISGLNAIRLFASEELRPDAENKLSLFFHCTINSLGMVQSCMPPPDENELEGYLNTIKNKSSRVISEDFCCPDIPLSVETNTAPVFAKKFTCKPKKHKSSINSKTFYSEYALYAVFEMLSINYPHIECFPSKQFYLEAENNLSGKIAPDTADVESAPQQLRSNEVDPS